MKTAYIKITHKDPKKAKEAAKTMMKFAKTIAKITGEDPEEIKIIKESK